MLKVAGSNPAECKFFPVAQLVEHMAVNHQVVGSNPTWGDTDNTVCVN